jgi:hypothetical protein
MDIPPGGGEIALQVVESKESKAKLDLGRYQASAGGLVHLYGCGYDVVIDLRSLEVMGKWPTGLRDEVLEWVAVHRDELFEEWNQ